MLENMMIGVLRAQNNIALAVQNQSIADSFIRDGRIRIYEAGTVRDEDGVKEGESMIAKGEAMKSDTFEHLDNAMNDLNSGINIVAENNDDLEASSEYTQEICSDNENTQTDSVGNNTKGNVKINVSFPRQRNFDVTV